MDDSETLARLETQDTRRRKTKQNKETQHNIDPPQNRDVSPGAREVQAVPVNKE